MLAKMKECKICSRKFADDRIDKHEKLCQENQERQRKSATNLRKSESFNSLTEAEEIHDKKTI